MNNIFNMELLAVEAELLEEIERRQQVEQNLHIAQTIIANQARLIQQYQHQLYNMLSQNNTRNTSKVPKCARRLNFDNM